MLISSWLRNRLSNHAPEPRAKRRPTARFRPRLEALDCRDLPSLTWTTSYQAGPRTEAVVAADVNGDGALDLVTANLSTWDSTAATYVGGGVSVRLGLLDKHHRPTGTFAAPQFYASGSAGSAVVRDFDGDGKVDIVTGNVDGTISILLGQGNGTFRQGPTTAGGGGSYLAAADVNGDGRLDLISSNGGTSIWLGNGDGSFRAGATYGGAGTAVAVGDFTGDGKADIVAVGSAAGDDFILNLLAGNGDGTFAGPQTIFAYPADPYANGYEMFDAITVADFNGDGKFDLAYTHHFVAGASIGETDFVNGGTLLGKGDGTFSTGGAFGLAGGAFYSTAGLVAADINRDGKLDLITVGGNSSGPLGVEVLPGHGDGTFGSEQDFFVNEAHFTGLAVGDFNGDGYADVAVTSVDWYYSGSSYLDVCLNDGHWKNFF